MLILVRLCPWHNGRRCYVSSCSVFCCVDGSVSCCSAHGNPQGFHLPKMAVRSSLSLIQLLSLRKKR